MLIHQHLIPRILFDSDRRQSTGTNTLYSRKAILVARLRTSDIDGRYGGKNVPYFKWLLREP